MLLAVFERAALMLMALFFLTRTRPFQHLLRKQHHSPAELAAVSLLFCLFAVFSTYTGIPVDGSRSMCASSPSRPAASCSAPGWGYQPASSPACTAT